MTRLVQMPFRKLAVALGLVLLAACGPGKQPIVSGPPPAPPVVVVVTDPEPIPMRPLAPRGASLDILLPAIGVDGVRETVNARLNPLEAVWNFRSGWNVAALNCVDARYQPILDGYKAMLSMHSKRLTKVNSDLDRQYRTQFGAGTNAIRVREAYLTQVYNYFALPPARDYFCDAALEISQQALLAPPTDIDAFALISLPKMEAAFERFYREMEQYRIAVVEWDARYGTPPAPAYAVAPSGPGPGAVYTSATYGPPAAAAADLAPARPAVQDFVLVPTSPAPLPVAAAPAPVQPAQQPVFSSEPVIQALPGSTSQ